ncbi:hypothetical protein Taro_032553 [Colocasia esculenta]|uniref:Thioredoxin domain-containing protein n=1 Tax=Colocasia esculenta TaxID=4460 RepID=A0A843VRM3_COLES|nr:hypothetical protein [Colocasia esculenta]
MGSFLSSLFTHPPTAGAAEGEEQGPSAVVAIHTKDNWNSYWESHQKQPNQAMVIDFSASWCGPCRFIEPAFKALASRFNDVVFTKIDVDELPDVAEKWGVQAMPTFVLLRGGREVDRVVGAKKDELEAKIAQKLANA